MGIEYNWSSGDGEKAQHHNKKLKKIKRVPIGGSMNEMRVYQRSKQLAFS